MASNRPVWPSQARMNTVPDMWFKSLVAWSDRMASVCGIFTSDTWCVASGYMTRSGLPIYVEAKRRPATRERIAKLWSQLDA